MAVDGERADAQAGPVLVGSRLRLRPGRPGDASQLHAILAEPSVSRWWGDPDPVPAIEDDLRCGPSVLLGVEAGGRGAGGTQYSEATAPSYRAAGRGMC